MSVTANDVSELKTQIKALQDGKENKIGNKGTAFNKNFGTGNGDVMRGDYAYSKSSVDSKLSGKENSIGSKRTAFNKDFGTVIGTVAQGNDSRFTDSRTPRSHASSSTTYGVGSSSSYGHLKLSDSVSSSSDTTDGVSATPKAVKTAYDRGTAALNLANTKENSIGSKGTAFNKNFGTAAGTVASGEYVAPTYTEATSLTNLTSGETTKVAFSKMKKWYTDAISKVGGLLIKVGTATLTTTSKDLSGAVNELNSNFQYSSTSITSSWMQSYTVNKIQAVGNVVQLNLIGTRENDLALPGNSSYSLFEIPVLFRAQSSILGIPATIVKTSTNEKESITVSIINGRDVYIPWNVRQGFNQLVLDTMWLIK